jgi:hypothetical protein
LFAIQQKETAAFNDKSSRCAAGFDAYLKKVDPLVFYRCSIPQRLYWCTVRCLLLALLIL